VLRTVGRWWGYNFLSGVSYYQLQMMSSRLYAVSWVLGTHTNFTLREAGWRMLVEVHSGLVLTMDATGDVVRLTSVQDERSAFKVLPMSDGSFQLFSAVGMAAPIGVGVPTGSRLRPVLYGNLSLSNVTIINGECAFGLINGVDF
jgi:hypothetical protein